MKSQKVFSFQIRLLLRVIAMNVSTTFLIAPELELNHQIQFIETFLEESVSLPLAGNTVSVFSGRPNIASSIDFLKISLNLYVRLIQMYNFNDINTIKALK